jgi:hypothetical protein
MDKEKNKNKTDKYHKPTADHRDLIKKSKGRSKN